MNPALAAHQKARLPLFGRSDLITVLVVSVLLCAPFLNKAFHIDDPVVLKCTANILDNPLDPFAGDFDWNGILRPFWQVTTNPPLLSYYLAPPVWLFGYSERVLHFTMILFMALLLAGGLALGKRFSPETPWFPALFIVTSPAVLVSSNVMRDIPAVSLVVLGAALSIRGIDSERFSFFSFGCLLIGLAAVTKYSAAGILVVIFVYALMYARGQTLTHIVTGLSAGVVPLAIWCAWTWQVYGEAHPLFLLLGKHASGTFPPLQKFFALLVTITSVCLTLPLVLWRMLERSRWSWIALSCGAAFLTLGALAYQREAVGGQYLVWCFLGSLAFLGLPLIVVPRATEHVSKTALKDVVFLLFWALFLFSLSVFLVPFQAVRHVLPGLVPAVLLCFSRGSVGSSRTRFWLTALLVAQLTLGLAVAWADTEYADTYRMFAHRVRRERPDEEIWFLGQWGWHFYARQAGFIQIHGSGPFPGPGALVVWPRKVFLGQVFRENETFPDRLRLIQSEDVDGTLPLHTMSFPDASFYSTVGSTVPFFFSREPLETLRLYRVE